MRKTTATLVALIATIVATACGGSPSSPTSPTPAPAAVSLAINVPADLFLTGTTAQLTASVQLSTGSAGVLVSPVWSSDTTSVATIDSATGVLTPVKGGLSTIRLSANGLQASASVRVVPSLQGTWQGTSQVTSCSDGRVGFCAALASSAQITLTLVQSRDIVTGNVFFGTNPLPISGSINQAGVLTLVGNGVSAGVMEALVSWSSQVSGRQMTGGFTLSLMAGGTAVSYSASLLNVTGPS